LGLYNLRSKQFDIDDVPLETGLQKRLKDPHAWDENPDFDNLEYSDSEGEPHVDISEHDETEDELDDDNSVHSDPEGDLDCCAQQTGKCH
jgi:hypothetical protein